MSDSFRILKSLGSGATSEVFLIESAQGKKFAFKRFHPHILKQQDAVDRLKAEIESLSQIQHPQVIRMLPIERQNLEEGLILEYVDGEDFRHWCQSHETKVWEPITWMLVQILRGLGAAHELHILHRDLKPENVLVTKNGEVKLSDFGLAKHLGFTTATQSGQLVGSLPYMAPETMSGKRASFRSDIYSFGILAYEAFSGTLPFADESPQGLIRKILEGRFDDLSMERPDLPEDLVLCIRQCLALEEESRPRSVWELESRLMQILLQKGNLPLIKRLCVSPLDTGALTTFLQLKRQNLLDSWVQVKTPSVASMGHSPVKVIQQMRWLFPDDPQLEEMLKYITHKEKASPKWLRSFQWQQFPFNFLPIAALQVFIFSFPSHLQNAGVSNNYGPPKANQSPEAQPLPIRVIAKKPSPAKIRFVLPEGVKVRIGERVISFAEASNGFEVEPGFHKVSLEKEGFLPIESSVFAKAEKEVIINAR